MPRNLTLAAFCATVAVAVPAGWHALDADIQTDGKHLRPLRQSFTVDGATVTLDVDRGLITTGDPVTVTLVATSETPKQVTVDLLALQSHNYEGARVESPFVPIDHEKLVLQAAPGGGKPVMTRIKLGTNPNIPAKIDSFRIYVRPHGMVLPTREYEGVDYSVGLEDGTAAAAGVLGWSSNSLGISIASEGPIVDGQPFVVAVRIKNISGGELPRWPSAALGASVGSGGIETGEDYDIESIDDDEGGISERPMRRGAVMVKKFSVRPKTSGKKRVTFAASAFVWPNDIAPVLAGGMEARTFTVTAPTESTPTVAAE